MKRNLYALAAVLVASCASFAAPKGEAEPLTQAAGPFVICVKGYMGPNAADLAATLAAHARRRGWPAYVYDHSAEEKRQVQELLKSRYGNNPEMAKRRTIRVQENWGVFVGGYRDLEAASKDLDKVKKTPFDDLPATTMDHVPDFGRKQMVGVSPYAHAFATRNPLVPAAKANAEADPAWKELNSGRPYNLLKCGKPYTLAVKQFHGVSSVQARGASTPFLEALMGRSDDTLDASAKQAEEVARVLRKVNLEAYVLHTRGASVVTIGAFDSENDPRLVQLQQKLRNGRLNGLPDARAAEMFQFFPQPMPMKVPKL